MTTQEKWRDLVKVKALYWRLQEIMRYNRGKATEEIAWSTAEMRGLVQAHVAS
jgi:hypothetical protein